MNKEIFITFIVFLYGISVFSQIKLKTYPKKIKEGYELLADNDEFCPVSLKVDFTLENMKSLEGNHKIVVIPAKTKGFVVSKLVYIKRAKYSFKTKTRYNFGNYFNSIVDNNFIYNLPFAKDSLYLVSQGYNGLESHQNENSIDFSMPVGTSIYAAREGIVIKVIENNSKSCPTKECTQYNNYILIYHSDGTFSTYVHLHKDGALVSEGEKVKKGQLIAKSGNTGWTTGPHLHFTVFNQKLEKRETLKTKFNIAGEGVFLKTKEKYKRTN